MSFDPYAEWLGIRSANRPPTHYELLGLEPFEADVQRIAEQAQRRYAAVHRYQAGRYSELAAQLLTQIAAAREALCDPARKAQYDALLRSTGKDVADEVQAAVERVRYAPHLSILQVTAAHGADVPAQQPTAVPHGPPQVIPPPLPVATTAASSAQQPTTAIQPRSATAYSVPEPPPSPLVKEGAGQAAGQGTSLQPASAGLLLDEQMRIRSWVWFSAGAVMMFWILLFGKLMTGAEGWGWFAAGAASMFLVGRLLSWRPKFHPPPASTSSLQDAPSGPAASPAASLPSPAAQPYPTDEEADTPFGEAMVESVYAEHAARRQAVGQASMPSPQVLEGFTNSLGMQFVLIPGGEFMMGSPEQDSEACDDEKPQQLVHVARPFFLARHQVTQWQYEAVMGENPSRFKGDGMQPVENVSWYDAIEFCRRLSELEGITYRLPTEAEWEYACRAGSSARWFWGDDPSLLDAYAWYSANAGFTTHPVGGKLPNAWGLYDVLGNVWEWCDDPWPDGEEQVRMVRGGCWNSLALAVRCAFRGKHLAMFRGEVYGFRVACDA